MSHRAPDPGSDRRGDAEVVSRLRHVRHRRTRAARHPRRPQAGAPPRALRDVRARAASATARYKKSARVVGEVLGKYHPHGDSPVYEALVRMVAGVLAALPARRRPGQLRLDRRRPAGGHALHRGAAGADRRTSCWPTSTRRPSTSCRTSTSRSRSRWSCRRRCPNLLVNGSSGIAVGMATNIPPHNLHRGRRRAGRR